MAHGHPPFGPMPVPSGYYFIITFKALSLLPAFRTR